MLFRSQPSPKRVPMQTVEQVLQLYRDQYFDFNVQHFYEKVRDVSRHQAELELGESGPGSRRIGEAAEEAGIASSAAAAPPVARNAALRAGGGLAFK